MDKVKQRIISLILLNIRQRAHKGDYLQRRKDDRNENILNLRASFAAFF